MRGVKPITVVGGGLAGLTLGIGLRQLNVPIAVWEAGCYPRHRVCGEFVSGQGQRVLEHLGLTDEFKRAGATLSRTAKFFIGKAKSPIREVTPPALCLSRFVMDQLLAQRFRAVGGELRENARFEAATNTDGVVWTTGRRAQPTERGWRWFGLKAHARGVALGADLEMHGSAAGYIGLCRLPGGEVNICGLFRIRPGRFARDHGARELLKGAPGSCLRDCLATAQWQEDSFCSVAALPLLPQRAADHSECQLGDALTMIPPVTGNGMSMAFEAAAIAIEPLAAYARDQISWSQAQHAIAIACDKAFGTRLAWARLLQWLMFSPLLRGQFGNLVLGSERLWRLLFTHTR